MRGPIRLKLRSGDFPYRRRSQGSLGVSARRALLITDGVETTWRFLSNSATRSHPKCTGVHRGIPNRLLSRNCSSTSAFAVADEKRSEAWHRNCIHKCLGQSISNLWLTLLVYRQRRASMYGARRWTSCRDTGFRMLLGKVFRK
jgi:hypothetical protein